MATGDITPTYGSWTDLTSTNLESLGDNEWWGSAVIDNTSLDALDVLIAGKLVAGANIDAGDTCDFYAAANVNSGDDDQWSGGIGSAFDPVNDDGNTLLTLDTEINDDNLFYMGTVTFSAASQTAQFGPFSFLQAFGGIFLPPRMVVIVHNTSTTAAEDLSTGNDIGYRKILANVAS